MRRQSLRWRLVAAFIGLLALGAAVSAQTAEVYFGDSNTRLESTTTALHGGLPVLFVHGHNFDNDQDTDFNYQKNWQNSLGTLPSFRQALAENLGLGIEPYYIRLQPQNRSITDDAVEIGDAIDLILHRHDPNYDYPHNPAQTTHVKIVIIAYSKGTISARQYLKSLQTQVPGLRAPELGFRPVSEFVAIAPPNHGLSAFLFDGTDSLALQQLHNGFRPGNILGAHCGESFSNPQAGATNYIQELNGHPTQDTLSFDPATDVYPSEGPGSRPDTDPATGAPNPPTNGILYVTIFANGSRDSVGGDAASNDCQGRRLALNLAHDAVNIPVAAITGNAPLTVHQNTVHTPEVMCLALYAATHHRSPLGQTCTLVNGVPVIPPPARAAAMLTLDFSGSMSAPAGSAPCSADRDDCPS